MNIKNRKITSCANRSHGAAAVEAAICLPLIILLMLGTLEVCAGFYLKESLTVAAYEGARTGVKRRATESDVEDEVRAILAARDVTLDNGGSITIVPSNFSSLQALDPITVRVTARTTGNSVVIFDSLVNREVSAQVVMLREFNE